MIPSELLLENVEKIYQKLLPFVQKTPIIYGSPIINEILNTNSIFKMEFLQNSGTFKARGVINNILNLDNEQKKIGITTVSAGNHAVATSYAANKFKIKNKIFMYNSANEYRKI